MRKSEQNPGQPERPKITQEHALFNERIVAVGKSMTEFALSTIHERCGDPPFEEGREIIRHPATVSLYFKGPNSKRHSRSIPGSIAGSDAFTINRIVLPEEGWAEKREGEKVDSDFPGRILSMTLIYGLPDEKQRGWDCRLYSGPDMPPMFVDEEATFKLNPKLSNDRLSSLGHYMENFTENQLIFPEEAELQTVLKGCAAVYGDIDIHELLDDCATYSADCEEEGPMYTELKRWFYTAAEQL